MDRIDAASLPLHEALTKRFRNIRSCLKKAPFTGSPMVVHNGHVIGGFASYYHSIREHASVETTGYDGPDNPLSVAIYVLSSIASEALILNDEYDTYKDMWNAVERASAPHNITVPVATHATHDMLYSMAKNGTVNYQTAIRFAAKFPTLEQVKILKLAVNDKMDIQSVLTELLERNAPYSVETKIAADQKVHQGCVESTRFTKINEQIRQLDEDISKAAFEKGRLIYTVYQERLYEDGGFSTFQDYYKGYLGLSKSYVYRLVKMYDKTPRMLKSFPTKRLNFMHASMLPESLIHLEENSHLSSLAGDKVTLDQLESCSHMDFERKLLPHMKVKAREKVLAKQTGKPAANTLLTSLSRSLNAIKKLPEKEKNNVIGELALLIGQMTDSDRQLRQLMQERMREAT